MEVVYHDIVHDDDEEEDIPDEDSNTSEIIQFHGMIVPRESITSNILSHSFIGMTPFSHLSLSEVPSRDLMSTGKRNNILSSHASIFSSQTNPMEINQSSFSIKIGANTPYQRSEDRAIFNWSMLYRKCMLEYRRHRLRKAVKGMNISPSPQKAKTQVRQQPMHANKRPVMKHAPRNIQNSKSLYKFYP